MKQKKYWLRYGIIGAGVTIPTFLIAIPGFSVIPVLGLVAGILALVRFIVFFPSTMLGMYVIGYPNSGSVYENILYFIIVVLNGFIFGAIIGWIYGKIKNKNGLVQ